MRLKILSLALLVGLLASCRTIPNVFTPSIPEAKAATTQAGTLVAVAKTTLDKSAKAIESAARAGLVAPTTQATQLYFNGILGEVGDWWAASAQLTQANQVINGLGQKLDMAEKESRAKDKQITKLQNEKNDALNKVWFLLYTLSGLAIAGGIGLCFVTPKFGICVAAGGIALLIVTAMLQQFIIYLVIGAAVLVVGGIGWVVYTHKDQIKQLTTQIGESK